MYYPELLGRVIHTGSPPQYTSLHYHSSSLLVKTTQTWQRQTTEWDGKWWSTCSRESLWPASPFWVFGRGECWESSAAIDSAAVLVIWKHTHYNDSNLEYENIRYTQSLDVNTFKNVDLLTTCSHKPSRMRCMLTCTIFTARGRYSKS